MRTIARGILALALTVGAPLALGAQAAARPSFAGTWALDPAQSDQGERMPTKLTQTITQSANEMLVDRAQTTQRGESTAKLKYALDGTPSPNETNFGGNPVTVTTTVTWEGATPVFTSLRKFGETEVKQVEKWALDPAGKKLTVTRTSTRDGQETTTKMVLVKQS